MGSRPTFCCNAHDNQFFDRGLQWFEACISLPASSGLPCTAPHFSFTEAVVVTPSRASFKSLHGTKPSRRLDLRQAQDGAVCAVALLSWKCRITVDPKTKQRVFKFVDVRPDAKLLGVQFNGRGLYATATIESGWFSAIKSISTPAVIAIRNDFYESRPAVAAKIRQSAEDALPAIAVRAGARPDWRQDFDRP